MVVRPPKRDRIEDTIDYNDIAVSASAIARDHIALIETFAGRLAAACLNNVRVTEAEVVVEKVGALVNGSASCRVRLRRACLPSGQAASSGQRIFKTEGEMR